MTYQQISSIPRQQGTTSPYALSSIDEVIAVMNTEHLNRWRMTYPKTDANYPTWNQATQFQFIQYYLDHCPYDLIVDYNHTTNVIFTAAQWAETTQLALDICNAFPNYQDRIWLEPQNEMLTSSWSGQVDLVTPSQNFVTAIRNAGFRNRIVSDVFWRTDIVLMANVNDPLDRFYTGQHIYFYSNTVQNWSLSSAEALMQRGLDAGLKLVNTETGADAAETAYFTTTKVAMVNDFMAWCETKGVENDIWMMYGDYNYPFYKNLGLTFPISIATLPLPYHNDFNSSVDLMTVNGAWTISGEQPAFANWFGVGVDYMCSPNSTNLATALSTWTNTLIPRIKSLTYSTMRLAFSFPSSGATAHTAVNYTNLDAVLNLLFQNGIGVIMDLHNFEDMPAYFGSDAWVTAWVGLVNHLNSTFPNEPKILAYELFNEPNYPYSYDPAYVNAALTDKVFRAYVKCVDAIRATGDVHAIVYSSPYFLRQMAGEDVLDTSIPTELVRSNIYVTLHEWFYTDIYTDMINSYNSKSAREQAWYDAGWNLWLGEYGESNNGTSDAQKEWARLWTVWALNHDIKGFNWYMHHGFSSFTASLDACQLAMQSAGFL